MKGKFVEFVRNLRDPVRARRQEKIREVELTWSDHDLSNFRVFAVGLQPGETADVCFALADGSAVPLLELLVDYAGLNDELMRIAFRSLDKTPLSARLFLSKRLMASKKETVRAAACKMLSGVPAAADTLEAALDDGSTLVVAAALRALVGIGHNRAEKKILACLKNGGDAIRLLALDALSRLHEKSKAFEKAALGILSDPDDPPELRDKAAHALAHMKSVSGCAALLRMLGNAELDTDTNCDTRCLAARALGEYADTDAAAALLNAAKGEPRALAAAAGQALSRMSPGIVLAVCERGLADADDTLALAAAEQLGGAGVKGATRALAARLAEENDPGRIAGIAGALGKGGDPAAWDALRRKLSARPDCAVPLVASLADCATLEKIDAFAELADDLPGRDARELVLRRLAAFCRNVPPTPAVLRRAAAMLGSPEPAVIAAAVEILVYSGEPGLRRRVLAEMTVPGRGFPVRRLLRVMLGHSGGELATLFEGADIRTSVLVPEAAAEAESMGRGGMEFFINLASWARHGAAGAREGLAAAAKLESRQLAGAMRLSPDRVYLLEAWAGLPRRERLENEPDLDQFFAACAPGDKAAALEVLSRIGEEKHLRTVALLAFGERDPALRDAALALVRRLIGGTDA